MTILDEIRASGAALRVTEEALYAEALREVQAGILRDGLWAKAFADCQGDETKARAAYLPLRVQSLRDEVRLLQLEQKRLQEAREQAEARTKSEMVRGLQEAEAQRQVENERVSAERRQRVMAELEQIKYERNRDEELTRELSRALFVRYEQTWLIALVRKLIVIALLVLFVLLVASVIVKEIPGGLGFVSVGLSTLAIMALIRTAITSAIVKCPQCYAENRVAADKLLDIKCGKCGHRFVVRTSNNP